MSDVISFRANSPLIGTWISNDPFGSTVEYSVFAVPRGFDVVATDIDDGENGQVSDIDWNGETLSFSTLWESTGRLCKCAMKLLSEHRVEFVLTFTEREIWIRKRSSNPQE